MEALRDEPLWTPAVHRPRSLHEAWELKRTLGADGVYVSGSTLLRTQWEAGTVAMPKALIDLRGINGLSDIDEDGGRLSIGALADLSRCRRNAALGQTAPAVQEAVRCIAAPAVRNLATIGGNIAAGVGDCLPALLVCDAELTVFDGKFQSRRRMEDWLAERWSGTLPPEEILTGLWLAPPAGPSGNRRIEIFRKVGRREAFTPSLVTVAIGGFIDSEGRLSGVKIAAGGGSGRPQRLSRAEALLEGADIGPELLASVYEAVFSQFDTYGDPFVTVEYKKKTAGNLLVAELWKALEENAGK
ncbi:FAD binding domain-containing protein [Paenibacillus sabinae]|uniref:Molybdopterin dehydrogenase FAD-binding protein n=1 Tax=Paenibacillus sabinae T27 TaxID=1268072 RepID=X4Z9E5_9BACL|nr:FAD binding domain-containing protein [Paenibacillus sabinae]AHV96291.1 molybdopterin dehydrogenase FAD-binding protein [Paenibacillus sabinae T27]